MSSAVMDLSQVEDGTDVAILARTGVERWTWRDGQMHSKTGGRLDPWFFAGYLNEGKVMLGNFAPPAVGEWFVRVGREAPRGHLVVKVDPNQTTAYCARILDEERFYDFVTVEHVVDTHTRVERPAWVNEQYVAMARQAYDHEQALIEARRQLRIAADNTSRVRYARDYLNAALENMQ